MLSLQPIGQDIWIADGESVSVAGFHYPTRMALIRLSDGGLFVWSPTALTESVRAEVDALGPVRFIVAPNSLHHLFIQPWQAAYPSAQTIAAPGLAKRRTDLAFSGELGDAAPAGWANDIDQVVVRGNAITTEVVFFHRASGTVLFTDLLQNFRPGAFKGWRALVAKLDGAHCGKAHTGLAGAAGADGPRPACDGGRCGASAARLRMAESLRGSRRAAGSGRA
jgi:hypothetical protein